ncbi:MAG: hypothetical protein IPP13_28550 [Kouleothrix sp.]|jgi:hypothetical protein|nr:hypothetical protein [Kouleothrix sp.]
MGIIVPLLIGIVIVALVLRPTPRTRVVYVPLEMTEERSGLGCLPLFLLVLLLLSIALLSGA